METPMPQQGGQHGGTGGRRSPRVFLICRLCHSRLEAPCHLAGRRAQCPTCGAEFQIPPPEELVRAEGLALPVGPEPQEGVAAHAYGAAGHLAPELIDGPAGSPQVRCRACGATSDVDARVCHCCSTPFTIEPATESPLEFRDGLPLVAAVLGGLALPTFPVPLFSAAALVCGLIAVGPSRRRPVWAWLLAWFGVVTGGGALLAFLTEVLLW